MSIHPSVLLSASVTLEEDVTIDHGVIFAAAANRADDHTVVRRGAHIGAGAVIGTAVEIGWGAYVQPGAVVLSSVPPNAIASGNPAQIAGYTTELSEDRGALLRTAVPEQRKSVEIEPLNLEQAAVYRMPQVIDMRGNLTVGEFGSDFPFEPKRYFAVFDVPSEKLRGEHAHYACHQFLICVSGSCMALLDDGQSRQEVLLDSPDVGLYMPPLIWGTQYRYSRDAVLLVFASHSYDPADYIRTYEEFQAAVSKS